MRILLAEDEVQMSQAESTFLRMKGFEVDVVSDGAQAVELAKEHAYDVMVLDIMMPVKDGLTALRELRESGSNTPVIMLTAMAEVNDRINGLGAGADDYLTKPFSLKELEARILAQVRRNQRFNAGTLTFRNLTLNTGELELSGRSSVRLSGKEARLMEYFLRNPERVLSVGELYRHVWPETEQEETDRVYVYVSYLRQKLRSIAADVELAGSEAEGFLLRGTGHD